jgi:hypothetical protein
MVTVAHEGQEQKEAEEAAIQLEKDEEKKRKERLKKGKDDMLEKRRRIRAVTKEIKLEEQKKVVERDEAWIARQDEKQLRGDIRLSKRRNKGS